MISGALTMLMLAAAASRSCAAADSTLIELRSLAPNQPAAIAPIEPFNVARTPEAGERTNGHRADVVAERNALFMLAAMTYAYTHYEPIPKTGFDIAALVAWDVDNIADTPSFVIDRNRNLEKRGNMYHAEMTVMRRIASLGWFIMPPLWRTEGQSAADPEHANQTIYSTLEPCPMCATAIMANRIPRAIYCMEDHGLRDPATRQPNVPLPKERLLQELSPIGLCAASNAAMWSDLQKWKEMPAQHSKWGGQYFDIIEYLHDRAPSIYRPAYDALKTYQVRFCENQEILEKLQRSFEMTAVGKSSLPPAISSVYDNRCPDGKVFTNGSECIYPRTIASARAYCQE